MSSIPDWSSANSSYTSSRGLGNAQALGFAQSMSGSLFGATADQSGMGAALFGNAGDSSGMGDAIFGPATILDPSLIGNGVSVTEINAERAKTGDSWSGTNPFGDPTTPSATSSGSDSTNPITYSNELGATGEAQLDPAVSFGSLTLDSSGNDILSTSNAPTDSAHFGGLAIDENGADSTDYQKTSDSDHFGSVGYAVTGNGSIVDLSV